MLIYIVYLAWDHLAFYEKHLDKLIVNCSLTFSEMNPCIDYIFHLPSCLILGFFKYFQNYFNSLNASQRPFYYFDLIYVSFVLLLPNPRAAFPVLAIEMIFWAIYLVMISQIQIQSMWPLRLIHDYKGLCTLLVSLHFRIITVCKALITDPLNTLVCFTVNFTIEHFCSRTQSYYYMLVDLKPNR